MCWFHSNRDEEVFFFFFYNFDKSGNGLYTRVANLLSKHFLQLFFCVLLLFVKKKKCRLFETEQFTVSDLNVSSSLFVFCFIISLLLLSVWQKEKPFDFYPFEIIRVLLPLIYLIYYYYYITGLFFFLFVSVSVSLFVFFIAGVSKLFNERDILRRSFLFVLSRFSSC